MTTYIIGVNNIEMKKEINISQEVTSAVSTIRSAILLSQERAVKAVNQEQLALYYGIGRFISANTRNKNCLFYEAWNELEINSPIAISELNQAHSY